MCNEPIKTSETHCERLSLFECRVAETTKEAINRIFRFSGQKETQDVGGVKNARLRSIGKSGRENRFAPRRNTVEDELKNIF